VVPDTKGEVYQPCEKGTELTIKASSLKARNDLRIGNLVTRYIKTFEQSF